MLSCCSLVWAVVGVPLAAAIWPLPTTMTTGDQVLWFDETASFVYEAPESPTTHSIIHTAIDSAYHTILYHSFVPWSLHSRNASFEPSTAAMRRISNITLTLLAPDPQNILSPPHGIDESYTLSVSAMGAVNITAATSIGASRAFTSLTQLFFAHSAGGSYTRLAPVHIEDKPVFAHRGINLDVARSFIPVPYILRTIDAAAAVKMNRLHLHITDSQAWPLEVPALPALSLKGAYSPAHVYTAADVRKLQGYGALRGVSVSLEIDMPGHTASIGYAMPELIAAFGEKEWTKYAAEPPSGSLKLQSDAVGQFLDVLLGDVLPRVGLYSAEFHTGGDEVNNNTYALDDTVKSGDRETLKPLLQKFVDHVHSKVRGAGLTPVVWQEMLLDWELTLDKEVVVQAWSEGAVRNITDKGFKALAGESNAWYLDCGRGAWIDYQPGDASKAAWPYADWCAPRKNWRMVYAYDPYSGVADDKKGLVLGGEVHLWTEQTDESNLDAMLWPRAAAAAEVLWSGSKDGAGNNRSQVEASPRLSEMRERLVAMGLNAEPVRMAFCSMDDGQSSCVA